MNPWHQYPFVRIVVPLMFGVVLCLNTNFNNTIICALIFILCTLTFLLSIRTNILSYSYRHVYGYILSLLFVCFGLYFAESKNQINGRLPIEANFNNKLIYRITGIIEEKQNTFKTTGLAKVIVKDSVVLVPGKLLVYFSKNGATYVPEYGDEILFKSRITRINDPQNPHEFNYKRYLFFKQIYYQAFVKEPIQIKKPEFSFSIHQMSISFRNHLLNLLSNNGFQGKEYAVAAAILLGYDELLDSETRDNYTGAGAMHVLCVSGLHVGIIYFIINSFLVFLFGKKKKVLRIIIVLACIWLYALITGLSPSVQRASVMLSFIIIGEGMGKKGNIYNSLAASAFVLICINPYVFFELGFQLSYSAVIGIVSFYPIINKLFQSKYILINKAWSIASVSIGAQLGTFPIAVFYFHQFPNYFLLTNMLVIILAAIILYAGMVFFIFTSIGIAEVIVKYLLLIPIKSLNYIVAFIEQLPGAVAHGLVLNPLELILIFLMIIGIYRIITNYSKRWIYTVMLSALVLVASFFLQNFKMYYQQKLIVYNVPNYTVVDFISGSNNYLLADSVLSSSGKLDFFIAENWTYNGIDHTMRIGDRNQISSKELQKFKNLFFFGNKSILIMEDGDLSLSNAKIDYLILSGNRHNNLSDIIKKMLPKFVILDSSISLKKSEEYEKQAIMASIPYYNVRKEGALVINL